MSQLGSPQNKYSDWGKRTGWAYKVAREVQRSPEWVSEGALAAASNILLAERKRLLQCLSEGDREGAVLRVSRTGLSLPELEDGIRALLRRRIALKKTGSLAPKYEQKQADVQASKVARDYVDLRHNSLRVAKRRGLRGSGGPFNS